MARVGEDNIAIITEQYDFFRHGSASTIAAETLYQRRQSQVLRQSELLRKSELISSLRTPSNQTNLSKERTISAPPSFMSTNAPGTLNGGLACSKIERDERGNYILYHPPIQHRDWGEPDEHHAAPWGEILFDLLYVAMAFKLGNLYASHLHQDGQFLKGFVIFCALFLNFACAWLVKLMLSGRFHTIDVFHAFLDIIEFTFIAMAVYFIPCKLKYIFIDVFEKVNSSVILFSQCIYFR